MEFQVVILRFGKFGAGKFFEKKKNALNLFSWKKFLIYRQLHVSSDRMNGLCHSVNEF